MIQRDAISAPLSHTSSKLQLLRKVAINPYLCEIAYVYHGRCILYYCILQQETIMANLIQGVDDILEILIAPFTHLL